MTDISLSQSQQGAGWRAWRADLLLFAVLLVAAFFVNDAAGYHNPDVSWLLFASERMLGGEQLYVDVWESNPPFSVLLYWPMVALEQLTGVRAELWVSLSVFAVAGASVALVDRLLKVAGDFPRTQRRVIALALLTICLFLLPKHFAEREHFGAMAMLPLLVLVSLRAERGDDFKPGFPLAALAGAMGAILLIVKPHYAPGYALPALFALARHPSWKAVIRPEYVAGVVVCAAYAAIVYVLFPAYVQVVMPIIVEVYASTRLSPQMLLRFTGVLLGPAAAILLVAIRGSEARRFHAIVWGLASAGFLAGYLLSGKGWIYHYYPALIAIYGALVFALTGYLQDKPWPRRRLMFGFCAAAFIVSPLMDLAFFRDQSWTPAELQAAGPNPRMAVISVDIAVANPRARILDADWGERDNSDYIPALALLKSRSASGETLAWLSDLTADGVERKLAYFAEAPVDFIIVDNRSSLWVDYMKADPRFAEILEDYTSVEERDGVEFLVRTDLLDLGPPI